MLRRFFLFAILPLFSLSADQHEFIQTAMKNLIEELLQGLFQEEEQERFQITEHTIVLPGGPVSYSAVTGTLPQFFDGGESVGEIFFTAYLKKEEGSERPITFVFNGGPGGSSLSMHIGGLGPRRLLLPEEGLKSHPPYPIIDNPQSILDLTDLVMIDPVGTGYSETDSRVHDDFFYGVEGDIFSFAEFIRVFCTHFQRWDSPKYLLGASYGTSRACGLAERLPSYCGIRLNGVILLGCALDYNTLFAPRDHALPDLLLLPSLAATAWYHGRLMPGRTVQEVVDYARRFALEDYAAFLMHPTRLSPREHEAFYEELATLTGLPLSSIRRHQGRISEEIFVAEFLAEERKVVGGIDSRYTGDVSSLASEYREDPSYKDLSGAFYPAFMRYLQEELQLGAFPLRYRTFSHEAFAKWDWRTYDDAGFSSPRPNFLQRLRRSLVADPTLRVFVGSGYYDLRTPFCAAEYSLDHLGLAESYRKNFQCEYYEAGHGFIFDRNSLQKLRDDLVAFYAPKHGSLNREQ
jgi:carboxypeptidase C (cathepsin A)